jgi:hypothetical protein
MEGVQEYMDVEKTDYERHRKKLKAQLKARMAEEMRQYEEEMERKQIEVKLTHVYLLQ